MKKRLLVISLLALAALLFAACSEDEPAGQTFTSTDTPMDVPADNSYTNSYITVTGGPDSITKVTVTVDVSSDMTDYLTLYLSDPSDTIYVQLVQFEGGDGSDGVEGGYKGVTFDDDASTSIVGLDMPPGGFKGTYIPEGSLADFIGIAADGDWNLSVNNTHFDTSVHGQLESWSITFE